MIILSKIQIVVEEITALNIQHNFKKLYYVYLTGILTEIKEFLTINNNSKI